MDTNASVLDRILDPVLSGETGRRLLDFKIDADAMARLEVLRERANEGMLTDAEAAEYDRVIHRLDLLSLMTAEARASLGRGSTS